ncbi:MAG TPA: hypothetical protein PLO90_00770 [Clostridia bacterium]|jgi:hypothetical protein|nr:hypothetical protein [Clostridia bacterium]HPY42884.1 hypothetical protein [Clostridia bacterium]HQO54867.1 hypothetical protein [Clostridia bacterium]HUM61664.1 hypothetical protein [Clostridia bacterium]
MNSYRFRPRPSFQASYGTRSQQRLLLAALVIFLVASLVLGFLYTRTVVYRNKAEATMNARLNSNLVDAISQVSRMAGGVQSNSAIKLGQIRQHIYAMDQVNTISMSISGEGGRLIPQEAINALYSVLERYEVAVQTATGNTLELRTLLLTHLMSLQELLVNQD